MRVLSAYIQHADTWASWLHACLLEERCGFCTVKSNSNSEGRQCQNSGDEHVEHPEDHLSLSAHMSLAPSSSVTFPTHFPIKHRATAPRRRGHMLPCLRSCSICSWAFIQGNGRTTCRRVTSFSLASKHKPQISRISPLNSKYSCGKFPIAALYVFMDRTQKRTS